jgi:hypothetical protein
MKKGRSVQKSDFKSAARARAHERARVSRPPPRGARVVATRGAAAAFPARPACGIIATRLERAMSVV